MPWTKFYVFDSSYHEVASVVLNVSLDISSAEHSLARQLLIQKYPQAKFMCIGYVQEVKVLA